MVCFTFYKLQSPCEAEVCLIVLIVHLRCSLLKMLGVIIGDFSNDAYYLDFIPILIVIAINEAIGGGASD